MGFNPLLRGAAFATLLTSGARISEVLVSIPYFAGRPLQLRSPDEPRAPHIIVSIPYFAGRPLQLIVIDGSGTPHEAFQSPTSRGGLCNPPVVVDGGLILNGFQSPTSRGGLCNPADLGSTDLRGARFNPLLRGAAFATTLA